MRKKWIRATLWLAGTFLLFVLIFTGVLYFHRDKITQRIVTEVNTLLEVPVEVESINVSLNKFPLASLRFSEVFCSGANAGEADTLLYANEVYFEFHLWKVLFDDLSIDRISMDRGTVNIRIPEDGNPNYVIWKETPEEESSGLFTLDKVSFNQFDLRIWHQGSQFRSAAKVDKLTFSGSFDAEDYLIESETDLYIDSLLVENTPYLAQASAKGSFRIRGEKEALYIEQGVVDLNDIPLSFGTEILADKTVVEAEGKSLDLQKLLSFVTAHNYAEIPDNLKIAGTGNIRFKGSFPDEGNAEIQTFFKAESGSLSGVGKGKISGVALAGTYSLQDKVDELDISEFSGSGQTGKISGALNIKDFSHPMLVLDLKSDLQLQEWLLFVPLDTLTNAHGKAAVDLHLENRFRSLSDIKPAELRQARAQGKLTVNEVSFTFKNSDKKITDLNGNLSFNNSDLRVENFYFKTGRSDIYLQGTFGNVLNYIYFDDEKLAINAKVRAQEIKMEDFIVSGSSNLEAEDNYNLDFAGTLDLNLRLEVDRFTFQHFHAANISGQLSVKEGVVKGQNLQMEADRGTFAGNFSVDTRPHDYYSLTAGLLAKDVDMHDLFVSFSNFGQEEIIADNIYGTADADLKMTAHMQRNLEIDPATVDLKASLSIHNGNLKNYEPMLALSRFADIQELQDVRFDHLTNDISIKGSEIIIPQMNISSNVMNLFISGRHSFENNIDYSMKLKLSDVMFSKRKAKGGSSEFDNHIVEVGQDDDPNIYIRMSGPAGDPNISLDKKSMGRSLGKDLKNQGSELKTIFSRKKEKEPEKSSGIKYNLFGEEEQNRE